MTLLPLVGVGALLLAAPALARQPVTTTIAIAHADLDLSTRRGLSMLDRRLAHATREACGYASASDLAGRLRIRHCRREARASALTQRDHLAAAARPVEVASGR